MNTSKIRGFLMQLPRPASVRVTAGEGEPQTLKVGRSFMRTAESIVALGCDLVECLDAKGDLLRALRLSDADAQRSDAAPIPTGIETDPHALMLTHFANLLHRAYEHSTEIAFVRLVEIVERLSSHSESIEARLERTESALRRAHTDQIEDALERAQEAMANGDHGGGDLLQQMATAWIQGKAATPPPPPRSNGKSNGKA